MDSAATLATNSPPPAGRSAPPFGRILRALVGREVRLASRRKSVRWLFLLSLLPVLVFAVILAVRIWGEKQLGANLEWDPVQKLLEVQLTPVLLLALLVGVPSVARDRAHDVLFLYATRPVLPVHYALGKWLSTALPAAGLLFLPSLLIAGLRLGLLQSVSAADTANLIVRAALLSALAGAAMAGVAVGASAAVKRDRNGYLLSLAVLIIPDAIMAVSDARPWAGPMGACQTLLLGLFSEGSAPLGGPGAALLFYALAGFGVARWRVAKEMVP